MAQILTDSFIGKIETPETGMAVYRDAKVKGLGVRVLPSGTKSYCLDYTAQGRRRVYTIGKVADWQLSAVREHAKALKHRIRYEGFDPAGELKADREAPTVADLCERFTKEHMLRKLRASTRVDYTRMIAKEVLPEFGNRKVSSIQFEDIDRLHRKITDRGARTAADFCRAMCSKLFSLACQWRWIDHNPVKGVPRNGTQPRNRYLKTAEIAALTDALTAYSDQDMADVFRLLLLTGARRGETSSATWSQFDLEAGQWTKPSHATKQNREHVVPLSAPAQMLLVKRRAAADAELQDIKRKIAKADPSERRALEERRRRVELYVFPAKDGRTGHLSELKKAWVSLCRAAGIVEFKEVTDKKTGRTKTIVRHAARIHDLRHTAASVLASSGASLPLIGQLLGHTQAATTARYAHLFDDAQRAAVERLGAIVSGGPSAQVIDIKKPRARR